jgi:hypothetical protein
MNSFKSNYGNVLSEILSSIKGLTYNQKEVLKLFGSKEIPNSPGKDNHVVKGPNQNLNNTAHCMSNYGNASG